MSNFPSWSEIILSCPYNMVMIGVATALPFTEHHELIASSISGPVCFPSTSSGLVAPLSKAGQAQD